jgi:hypothetical protein
MCSCTTPMTVSAATNRLDLPLARILGYGSLSMMAGVNKRRTAEYSTLVTMRKFDSISLQNHSLIFNSVSLKLSHLQPELEVAATQDDAVPIVLPSNLQYSGAILGQDDIDTSIGSRLAKRKFVQRTAGKQNKAPFPRNVSTQRRTNAPTSSQQELMEIDEDHPLPAIGQMSLETRDSLTKSQALGTTGTETQGSTQTREDRATRGRLETMVSGRQLS